MDKKKLKSALEWQVTMGVEDSFSKTRKPKKAVKAAPAFQEPSAQKWDSSAAKPTATKPAAQTERKTPITAPANDYVDRSGNEWIKLAKELADKAKTLEELKLAVEKFDGLAIKKSATNTVFSDGNPESELMLIGEAPGENEDLEGRPFCGVSGRLLDKLLKFGGYTREKNFYITNTIFWRPPGNRKPTPDELAICKPFVEKHIALINPKVIVLVGGTAAESVLNSKDSVTALRKKVNSYHSPYLNKDIPCFTIYHPSFLLRSPSQKKNAWADMLKIKAYLAKL